MSGDVVVQALVADLAYFYRHSGHGNPPSFALSGGNTSTGIADTARGVVNAGLVSRNLLPDDPAGLVLTPMGLSGICLISNRQNPVPGLTRAQIQDIVAARITNWSQIPGASLNGRDRARRPHALHRRRAGLPVGVRRPHHADRVAARDGPHVAAGARLRGADPGAFGYVDLALTEPVHAISYEGTGCTLATIKDGSYPARRPLGVVTRGRPRGAMARFLRWVTTSRKARQVIATRYVPLR